MPLKYFSQYPTTASPMLDLYERNIPEMYVTRCGTKILYDARTDRVDLWHEPEKTWILYGTYERAIVTAALDMTHMFGTLEIIKFESLNQIMNSLNAHFDNLEPEQIVIIVGVPNDSIIDLCEAGAAAGDTQNMYLILCSSELTTRSALYDQLNEHNSVYACDRITAHEHCMGLLYIAIRDYSKKLRLREPDLPEQLPWFHRELAWFRNNEYKYMKFVTRPVKEWFAMQNTEVDTLIVQEIMHMAFSSNPMFNRRIKSSKYATMLKFACR
jgi:hypothetical protein